MPSELAEILRPDICKIQGDSYDWEGLSGFINRYSRDCRKFQKIIQQIDFQLNIYSYLCIQKKEFTKKAVTEQNSGEKSAAA